MEKFRLVFCFEAVEGLVSDFLYDFLVGLINDDEGALSLGVQITKLLLVDLEGIRYGNETSDMSLIGKINYYSYVEIFQIFVLIVELLYQAAHRCAFNPHLHREFIQELEHWLVFL